MDNTCRICLGEGTGAQPLRQRCNCAYYHDDCFISLIKHNNRNKCEICNENFRGITLAKQDTKIASFNKFINVILVVSACFITLCWINYNSILELNQCINNVYYKKKSSYYCINLITGIQYYSFTIYINQTVLWFIIMIISMCFSREFGFEIYKTICYLTLDTGPTITISNLQYLSFDTSGQNNRPRNELAIRAQVLDENEEDEEEDEEEDDSIRNIQLNRTLMV